MTIHRSLNLLYPPFALQVTAAIIECQQAGLRIAAFETYRTAKRQDELFLKHPPVTKAQGGKSWHQYGLAVDLAFKGSDGVWSWNGDLERALKVLKESPMVWGGPNDQLHFQAPCTRNITTTEAETMGVLDLWAKIRMENL